MLYLLRHGQTDYNLHNRIQGQSDIPLNETGIKQARDASALTSDLQIDICYCSPLQRARQTAEIFLEGKDIPIINDDRLKEISFGGYEGDYNVRTDKNHPLYIFFNDLENYVPTNGAESIASLFARSKNFLKDIVPLLKEGKNVLVVAHGALNLSIYAQAHSIALKDYWKTLLKNGEVASIDNTLIYQLLNK